MLYKTFADNQIIMGYGKGNVSYMHRKFNEKYGNWWLTINTQTKHNMLQLVMIVVIQVFERIHLFRNYIYNKSRENRQLNLIMSSKMVRVLRLRSWTGFEIQTLEKNEYRQICN